MKNQNLSKAEIAALVAGAPIAAATMGDSSFWDEVEARAELREKQGESLVEPRPAK